MRYRAVISYFGKGYVGWQRQLNGMSVQEVLEKALEKTFGTPTGATASGRTDAGVHAQGQVVHFDADTSIPVDKIPFAVNTHLPDDVSMLSCEIAPEGFNARFSAKRKTYRYNVYVANHRLPVLEQTHEHITCPLDIQKMRQACAIIEGTHNFKCFQASGSVVKNTVRTVYSIELNSRLFDGVEQRSDGLFFNGELSISVTGNGFLYNMVRIIAGTLVYVGIGKLTPDDVALILQNGDRKRAGKTLGAKGLVLEKVEY